MEQTEVKTELSEQDLEELNNRVQQADQAAADGEDVPVDEYGLPFEPEGFYNSAPLQFEEMAQNLWIVLDNTHYLATRYNRHSPYYLLLINKLEKYIKQMGSVCITKAVMEAAGTEFTKLGNISFQELICMASLHFRKCALAYNDIHAKEHRQDLEKMGWMFRWAALVERLKATGDKIQKIKDGKIDIQPMLERAEVCKGAPRMRRDLSDLRVDPQLKASSLPVMRSFTGEIKKAKKFAEKQEAKKQREAERAARRLEKGGIISPGPMIRPSMIRPAKIFSPEKIPGLDITPDELRKLLMDEAKSRGNMAEAGIIAAEDLDKLVERWENLMRQGRVQKDPASRPRSGPSDETRKKLREKRKKKR